MYERFIMRIGIVVALFLLLTLLAAPAGAAAREVPWASIAGGTDLGGAHKTVAEEVIRTAKSYGECKGTILECITAEPADVIASRLAAFVVRRAAAGNDAEQIRESIQRRKLSAFAIRTYSPSYEGLVPSGNPGAPVKVLIYADFECPYCRVASTALRKLSLEEPDKVAFYFKNFPLKSHKRSVPAALAYLAALRQDAGWKMHDLLFDHQEDLSDEVLEKCAESAGLDLAKYRADIADKALIDRLRAEKTEGMKCGIKKSPGILINGKTYFGVKTAVELRDRIEEELYLLGKK